MNDKAQIVDGGFCILDSDAGTIKNMAIEGGGARISLLWSFGYALVNNIGFANIMPVGLALYSRAAPRGLQGLMIGIYYLHLFIEAKKLAFADRARFYTDPEFATLPVRELISKEYAARQRKRIDILHEHLGFERERIREWTLAHAILSAWWGIEDNTGWETALQFAELLAELN